MFILGNLLISLANILHLVLNLYMYIIIARALISWVNPDPYNQIVRVLYNITEPVLRTVRRFIPISFGGLDFSPVIVIFVIYFLDGFLVRSLASIAMRMGT